jgi:hypothetical protein
MNHLIKQAKSVAALFIIPVFIAELIVSDHEIIK